MLIPSTDSSPDGSRRQQQGVPGKETGQENWQRKRPARGRPFRRSVALGRSVVSVLGDDRAAEVVVHADLDAVQFERSGGHAEVGLAVEAAEEVLALDRPLRSEEGLDARADGPAGVEIALRG